MDDRDQYRRQRRRVFALSFALSFLAMGFIAVFAVFGLVFPGGDQDRGPQQSSGGGQPVYLPSPQDRLTLLAVSEGPAGGVLTFALVGFYPDTGSMPIAVLPQTLGLPGGTLRRLYQAGGPQAAARALRVGLGVQVDRVAAGPGSALAALLDRAGGLDFQLPVTLTDPAGGVLLTAGRQQLDGQTAAAVLGCSGWPGGEEQRCNVSAALLAAAVNTHLPLALGSRAEDFFARAVNGCTSTDLTARDYADHIEAARFMARLAVRPAQGLEVGGSHGPSGAFAADSSTLALLRTCFGPQDAAP